MGRNSSINHIIMMIIIYKYCFHLSWDQNSHFFVMLKGCYVSIEYLQVVHIFKHTSFLAVKIIGIKRYAETTTTKGTVPHNQNLVWNII